MKLSSSILYPTASPQRKATPWLLFLCLGLLFPRCQLAQTTNFFFANDGTRHSWRALENRIEVPFKVNGVVLIPIRLNDSAPVDFGLDTGAAAILLFGTPFTNSLRLSLGSTIPLAGSGRGANPLGQIVQGLKLTVGELDLADQTSVILPWQEVPFFEAEEEVFIEGVIGYDLFRRFVVELDFERRVMTLSKPDSYHYRGPGEEFELTMHMRKPYIMAAASVAGGPSFPIKLHVDIGSSGTLSLIPNSHPQLQLPLKTVSAEGFGLSGKTESLLGRLDRLELASFRLNDVIASFSLQGYGTAGKRNGVLGWQVLERFKVIFNYPEGRMILEETGHTNDPFLGDMIGFGLQPFRQSFVIKRVVPSSPASESGLQKGDVLVSVDGVAIESLTPTELKKALSGQQGSQVEICVRRPTNDLSLCRQLQRRRRI